MPVAKIIALTAPSGSGKTTIARRVLEAYPAMRFSVSATTRPPREHEVDGRDYHFVSQTAFQRLIEAEAFVEFEEVYPGRFYGTLRSEVENGTPVLLDIDVKGALQVKARYGDQALVLFVRPPSLGVLAERLRARGTETEASLQTRLERAEFEMQYAERFDAIIVNDDLERAVAETLWRIQAFLDAD